MIRAVVFVCILLLVAGCASNPTAQYALGDVVMQVDFSPASVWQEYVHPEQNVDFRIEDGEYRAKAWDGGER